MTVETDQDIEALKAVGRIVALAIKEMAAQLRAGITTRELDEIGRSIIEKNGARSAPEVTYNFPGATCISVNEEAAHGIPGSRVIRAGELVNIDVSAELDGYYADSGASFSVAPMKAEHKKLCDATRSALWKAIHAVRAGQFLNVIGRSVEQEATRRGFRLVKDLTGHGVGRSLHEEPSEVWNFYQPKDRRILKEGMVFTIEPFLTYGSGRILTDRNGWTYRTADRSLVAQYEHTLIVTKGEPIITTML